MRGVVAAVVVALGVGLAAGRWMFPAETVRVRTETVTKTVAPPSCTEAVNEARHFTRAVVRDVLAGHERMGEVAYTAYQLGVRGDEEEATGGLGRLLAESEEIAKLWASEILVANGAGWAETPYGNLVTECLNA